MVHELWLELSVESEQTPPPLNDPPLPPSFQATPPVGVDGDALVSVTVIVKLAVPPAGIEAGLGETVVVVGCGGGFETVRDEVPELETCVDSPE